MFAISRIPGFRSLTPGPPNDLTMLYLSTRGDPGRKHFCEILLEGLAPDGGLYLPEHDPQVDAATLESWRGLPYHHPIWHLFVLGGSAAHLIGIVRYIR